MAEKKRRAYVKDKEKEIIAFVLANPGVAREPLAQKMIDEIDWGGKAPEPEVLWKKISKYRNVEPDPQDGPWHLSIQDADPRLAIPNDAIPAVLKVWARRAEKDIGFTIREAKWVARLSGVVPDMAELSRLATVYAVGEQMNQYVGLPFKSTVLDRAVMGLPPKKKDMDDMIPTGLHVTVEFIEGERGQGPPIVFQGASQKTVKREVAKSMKEWQKAKGKGDK